MYIFDAITLDFLLVNKGARENLGYSMDELSGMNPIDIKPDYTRADFLKLVVPLQVKSQEGLFFETRHERKNGTLYNVEIYLQVAEYQGKEVFLAIVLDVTERVKLEQERETVSKILEESNRELEEFAYRTSHDLRSPLVSSIKLVSIVEAAMNSGNNDRAINSIKHIQTSLVKLETLVKDIHALTKTKNVEEDEKLIDLDLIVDDALSSFSHMDNFARLNIEKHLHFDEDIMLKSSRLSMIVENLISNAIKYQDIQESQSFIKISTAKENNSFVLTVEDNGLGIPAEHQASLFSMFKRFHSKVSFGSGLGLYMVKKSADILGGELVFEQPKKGTRFVLTIPLKA